MKTISTTGPKCQCGYGMNQSVSIPEQKDIDELKDKYIAAGMDSKTAAALAKVNTPNGHLVWTKAIEDEISRDQMRQCTFVHSAHTNEDGTCPGKVGVVPNAHEANVANARKWNFAERLDHAKRAFNLHKGNINPDAGTKTVTLAEINKHKTRELARAGGKTVS